MLTSFNFKNFEPTTDLVIHSNTALDRLLDHAPYGSPVFAQLEKADSGYWAAVDVASRFGPFSGRSFAADPKLAVSKVVEATLQKISHWKMERDNVSAFGALSAGLPEWGSETPAYPVSEPRAC